MKGVGSLVRQAFFFGVILVGVILVLYALALVFLGMEDVGGPKVAGPAAIAVAAAGVGVIIFGLRRLAREAAEHARAADLLIAFGSSLAADPLPVRRRSGSPEQDVRAGP